MTKSIILFILLLVGISLSGLCSGDPEQEKEAKLKRHRAAAQKRMAEEKHLKILWDDIAKGCESTAVFEKLLSSWYLSVPSAGSVRVDEAYPKDKNKIKRAIEDIGAGDPVLYRDFLRVLDEC